MEYWSLWNRTSTATVELPHTIIPSILVDKSGPTGAIAPSGSQVQSPTVTLSLSASDAVSGIAQMRFSNGNNVWSDWEPYATAKTWSLTSGDGAKTVTVEFADNAGLTSTYSTTVNLLSPTPSPTPSPTATPTPRTSTPTPTPTASPTPTQTTTPTPSPSNSNSQGNTTFESLQIILVVFSIALAAVFAVLFAIKLRSKR